MTIKQRAALVERPVACAGRGQYIALVYYGSKGGDLHHRVLRYSYKDPRQKGEAAVLRDISQMIAAHYRDFIVAIAVVKKCLHPKSDQVAKKDRHPHFERVFSWIVEHNHSLRQAPQDAKRRHLEDLMEGHKVQAVLLPYTLHELQELPVKHVVTTRYWKNAHVSVGVRGVERFVSLPKILT